MTIIWLKRPNLAPDLPRKRIIADCFAALNPPDTLWRAYLNEIDRLRGCGDLTDEDYHVLRFSMEARNALMNATMGDPDAFAEGTLEQVLARAREAIRAESESRRQTVESELESERTFRLDAERRADAAESARQADRQAREQRYSEIGQRVGRMMGRVMMVAAVTILLVTIWLTLPRPLPSAPDTLLAAVPTLVALCLLGYFGLSAASLINGTTLRSLIERFENSITHLIQQLLMRIGGP